MEAEAHRQKDRLKTGFCYSDVSSAVNPSCIPAGLVNHIHTIDQSNPDQMFSLTSNMEMMGYFPSANDDQSSMVVTSSSWQDNHRLVVDDSSLGCVLSDEGNDQRASQGLSLSLSSINPSGGFESFELRHNSSPTPTAHHKTEDHQMRCLSSREGYYRKSLNSLQTEQQMRPDDFLGKVSDLQIHQHVVPQFQLIRHSKYLKPAQELLSDFCSLGSNQSEQHRYYHRQNMAPNQKVNRVSHGDHNVHAGTDSSRSYNLYSLELLELQKRKAQLLSMLEEVDRRYKHYCDQIKAVVSSFEAAAGSGAATVYSAVASKAMSRHFRCLRDGIVDQIRATKKAMGEKDDRVSRGETPRLRLLLDQTLRQQKAFQQLNMMESHPWRPQRGLPERSVSVLLAWLFEHFLNPYPTDVEKHILARQTGLSRSQVSNWFINARVRLWKPMVEEMYMEETKEELENTNTSNNSTMSHPAAHHQLEHENKPGPEQLIRIDSDCLSSIINHHNSRDRHEPPPQPPTGLHPFGAYNAVIELDFSSFSGSSVSLTLGLQQHGESGVSLSRGR